MSEKEHIPRRIKKINELIKDLENIAILSVIFLFPPVLAIGFGMLVFPELVNNSFITGSFSTSLYCLIVFFFITVVKDFFKRDKEKKE